MVGLRRALDDLGSRDLGFWDLVGLRDLGI